MNYDELVKTIKSSGVVGAGGAGFPTYAKLDRRADTLILNCAECEPLLKLHRQLLERNAYEILSTLDLISKTVGAKQVIIGIKGSYKNALAAIESLLDSFQNISVCRLPEVYPAGDEVVLIYEATGRVVEPGSLPITVGVTVFNVETIYNVSRALEGENVTHKYVTVAGEVRKPMTLRVPIGTTVGELIDYAGGSELETYEIVLGGPMMGSLGNRFDVVKKTTNAILVLPPDHYIVKKKQAKQSIDIKRAMAACCQCTYCTDLCPRHLLGHPIDPAHFMLNASHTMEKTPYLDAAFCSGCGLCEMYSCGQGLSPRSLLDAQKAENRKNGLKPEPHKGSGVPDSRRYRRVPMKRLAARIGVDKYNKTAPMLDDEINPKTVTIMLSQHIGAPAKAVVFPKAEVKCGQIIAAAGDGLCVNIHASIDGVVTAVNDKFIKIARQ
ncbi:MAG: SLBB domain-containing protein [Clostridia bacterium]|nr:SLBB domain-containing protein [Clostridia bacterium]